MSNNKTKQLLGYLSKEHSNATVTVLMKLAYLTDLISTQRTGAKISSFDYQRYHFGPFDQKIYTYLNELVAENILIPNSEYTRSGGEAVIYRFNESKESDFVTGELNPTEIEIIDELLESVGGYGAKTLTQIAYKTKPMQKIGATLGGSENMGITLDLSI
ncbi:MAG: Panacea domain-containing protein [Candidatus Moranbacteria bacterium]|nr:Panacea domain-containing protein [Candidatus Moranbacteria bacterium]